MTKTGWQREWKSEEILAARDYLIGRRPGLWEKLKEVEATTKDFRDLEITELALGALLHLHPEPSELSQLFRALRRQMLKELSEQS